jgi:hypothetical protein
MRWPPGLGSIEAQIAWAAKALPGAILAALGARALDAG